MDMRQRSTECWCYRPQGDAHANENGFDMPLMEPVLKALRLLLFPLQDFVTTVVLRGQRSSLRRLGL